MDRVLLEQLLAKGLSLAEIGRRVGLHESTVSYWTRKHGLAAAHGSRHAAKGGISREQLKPLVDAGLSSGQMAELLGLSKTTVRHWLREHGMQTWYAQRRVASAASESSVMLRCPRHGMTRFGRRAAGGYRCNRCRADAVSRRRRRIKRLLVDEAGGACVVCGYDRYVGALEFHHLVPAEKRFALSHRGVTRSLAAAREEARRCVLLCANCHAEVEGGLARLPEAGKPRVQ